LRTAVPFLVVFLAVHPSAYRTAGFRWGTATSSSTRAGTTSVGPETPDGAHVHIAGKTEDGFRVIEVWDSPEHIERFMDTGLAQAMQEAQIPEPTITEFEVHKLDWVRG
jgi:hypothetical protein